MCYFLIFGHIRSECSTTLQLWRLSSNRQTDEEADEETDTHIYSTREDYYNPLPMYLD